MKCTLNTQVSVDEAHFTAPQCVLNTLVLNQQWNTFGLPAGKPKKKKRNKSTPQINVSHRFLNTLLSRTSHFICLFPGSRVNLGSLGLHTITHPVLTDVQWSSVCVVRRNVAFLQQSDCIRNISRASFKGVCLHIESVPASIRLDGLNQSYIALTFLYGFSNPSLWFWFPLWSHFKRPLPWHIPLCSKTANMCLPKMFQMRAHSAPRGAESVAHTNKRHKTIAECKGRASTVLSPGWFAGEHFWWTDEWWTELLKTDAAEKGGERKIVWEKSSSSKSVW